MTAASKLPISVRLGLVMAVPTGGMLFFAAKDSGATGLITALIIAAAAYAGGFILFRPFTRQVKALHAAVSHVASTADFTTRAEQYNNDDLGSCAGEFNRMLDKLHSAIHPFIESAGEIGAAAQHLHELAEQANRGTRAQQEETNRVATAMTEMVSMVQEIATNTGQAATATEQARGETQNGALVATEAMCAIEAVFSEMDNATGAINQLDENSRNIGVVLDVIGGISDQTNLLALNAAIEAARAGEHGRGFAVVAQEVRELASKTQESIQQIRGVIEQLQHGAQSAVTLMGKAQKQAQEGVEQVEASAESLGVIAGEVATIWNMNNKIAAAAQYQESVVEEISNNVANINAVASDTADGAEKTSAASAQLQQLAERLQQAARMVKA